jgi:polyribonucleotide nucleotidyltransferase
LPLTVDYQDRTGASGAIPGGFMKREGRSTERETLASRSIDRPLRPMFPKHFRNEMQCITTNLSYDRDAETDVLAICGASAAFAISPAPMAEAVAGVRVVRSGGKWHLNPTKAVADAADVSFVVAGTIDAITMVEGGANECAEADVLDALDLAHGAIKAICAVITSSPPWRASRRCSSRRRPRPRPTSPPPSPSAASARSRPPWPRRASTSARRP